MTGMFGKIQGFVSGAKMAKTLNLQGRHFIVTGCAKGSLGFATALQLLEQGAVVSVTVRKNSAVIADALRQQLAASYHPHMHAFDLDLASYDSVEAFVQAYKTAGLALDVLINNAGIHLDLMSRWTSPTLSDDGFEIQWRVNYLGSAHLTYRLLPLLQASAATSGDSRIVNVVSQLHSRGLNSEFIQPRRPYNSWNAYGQSKLALVHLTRSIDRHFAKDGITSYCLHPGAVYTNVADKGLAGTGSIAAVRNALAPIERFFMKTPKQGAQTQIHCATAPKGELASGAYYRNMQIAIASAEANDSDVAERLWLDLQSWISQSER
ncbi:SDR family NAD(P)-dependent oxidoreductase [Zhongshania sp.]|uniref:SDR family NAD(P)-dependent oxidoreductase n=1 Tax=Zhongshania sp. TaxID=1971902 RepID=UPI001B5924E9|nr:SDR family NAD(P)-dependent oxidoreductase [Zhongshania sp.]MBQ0795070.1 SDR family NAD(P)-dependent oxidoreductase [Zhongshania sp.]